MPKRSRKVQPFPTDPDEDDPILAAHRIVDRIIARGTIATPNGQRVSELERVCREAAEFARAGGLPERVIAVLDAAGNGQPIPPAFLLPIMPEDFPKEAPAVALGRKGGLKGGKARAEKLTAAQRRKSARVAARARWGTRNGSQK